ncbi:hypothetical protein FRX31_002041 [Thalictrum thalictroides]|uniref:Uncharacterized protein n=1 Tax=Thalictrum thalictroides TaxID=46969 RepID=A0A7J6XHR4_THATH|nr:hypothetical protein FRX31_002041 [Thalictrum thalictroides]
MLMTSWSYINSEYCKSSGKDYVSHHLTLLTYNQNLDEYVVFDTKVVKFLGVIWTEVPLSLSYSRLDHA